MKKNIFFFLKIPFIIYNLAEGTIIKFLLKIRIFQYFHSTFEIEGLKKYLIGKTNEENDLSEHQKSKDNALQKNR